MAACGSGEWGGEERLEFVREVAEGVADGEGDTAAEGAETGEFHGVEEIADEVGVDAERGIGACFGEEFLTAGAAEAAGEAFAAGFVGGELEEVFEVGDHGHGFGDADDAGVAEEETCGLEGFEVDGELTDEMGGDETAEGAADVDGFDGGAEAAGGGEDIG